MTNSQKAVLRTLAYADVFDYPLTQKEILNFLICDQSVPKAELQRALQGLSAKVIQAGDHFFLKGRTKIVPVRKRREKASQKKLKIARQVVGWLKLIPWVKMIGVTGALSMANSESEDDIDILIVTAKNRTWLTRGLVVVFLRFWGLYRRPDKIKDKVCPNMFLDEVHLSLPRQEQDLFLAHEVCQLKPILNKDKTYQMFVKKNQWVKQFLPNWKP